MQITAVENNSEIAKIYKDSFPNDKIIIADAHQYLLEHFKEYDFIWSSPPCPTHSRTNTFLHAQGIIRYPDMKLWQEIIFLQKFYYGKWCIENVISYYEPLIKPTLLGRHYFWTNFFIPQREEKEFTAPFNIANARASTRRPSKDDLADLSKWHGFDLTKYKTKNARLMLRNCVYPPLGKYILDCAFTTKQCKITDVIA